MNRQRARQRAQIGVAVLLGLVWLAHVLAALRYPIGNDPAIFQYHAWAMTQGVMPYVDSFEFNTPGIIGVHWFLAVLIGFSGRAFIGAVVALGTASLAVATLWLRRRVSTEALLMGLGGAIWLFSRVTPWDRGQRELFQGLLLVGAFAAGSQALAGPRPGRWGLLMGALAGAAVTIKVTFIGLAWAVWVVWLVALVHSRRTRLRRGAREALAGSLMSLLGFLLPIAGVLGWLAAHDALADFWHIQVTYLPIHARQLRVPIQTALSTPAPWITLVLGVFALVAARKRHRTGLQLLGIAHLAAVALYLAQGHGWTYHLQVVLPLALPTIALTADALIVGRWRLVAVGLALVFGGLAGSIAVYDHGRGLERAHHVDQHWDHDAHLKVAALLRKRSQPGDRVLTNNDEHQLLLYARRLAATPYLYGFLFSESQDDPTLRRLGIARWAEANTHPPQWVVWNQHPYRPDLDSLEANPNLADWVDQHCTDVVQIGPYRVLRCPSAGLR